MINYQHDKFLLYLNSALAMENGALRKGSKKSTNNNIRRRKRQQLQHHLEETREQQDRLRDLITKIGGTPTQEKGELPISKPPEPIRSKIHNSMNSAEAELVQSVEDTIVENAEVVGYNLLIQMAEKMNIGDATPVLRQNLQEEEKMFGWLRANAPAMFAILWPQMDSSSSVVTSADPKTTSSKLNTTTQNIADISQTFKCESCDATFNSREDLRQHAINKHEGKQK